MRGFLIDTQIVIWFLEDPGLIPKSILKEIKDPKTKIFFSQISMIEMGIKIKIGKLKLSGELKQFCSDLLEEGLELLPISNEHIFKCIELPLFENHKDPFDRLIISTGWYENLKVLSTDRNFQLYDSFLSENLR
jgi:PIN domain nuclease of toxin-antitoxin system